MASARQRVKSRCLKSKVRSKRSRRRSAGMIEMPAKGVGRIRSSARTPVSAKRSATVWESFSWSSRKTELKSPWESQSMSKTRCPCSARTPARLVVVVVLPTPPLCRVMANFRTIHTPQLRSRGEDFSRLKSFVLASDSSAGGSVVASTICLTATLVREIGGGQRMQAENFLVDQISAGSLGEGPVALEQLTRQAGCTGKSPLLQRFALSGRETVQVAVDVLAAAFRPGFGSLLRPALGLLLPAVPLVALALPLGLLGFGPFTLAFGHIGGRGAEVLLDGTAQPARRILGALAGFHDEIEVVDFLFQVGGGVCGEEIAGGLAADVVAFQLVQQGRVWRYQGWFLGRGRQQRWLVGAGEGNAIAFLTLGEAILGRHRRNKVRLFQRPDDGLLYFLPQSAWLVLAAKTDVLTCEAFEIVFLHPRRRQVLVEITEGSLGGGCGQLKVAVEVQRLEVAALEAGERRLVPGDGTQRPLHRQVRKGQCGWRRLFGTAAAIGEFVVVQQAEAGLVSAVAFAV